MGVAIFPDLSPSLSSRQHQLPINSKRSHTLSKPSVLQEQLCAHHPTSIATLLIATFCSRVSQAQPSKRSSISRVSQPPYSSPRLEFGSNIPSILHLPLPADPNGSFQPAQLSSNFTHSSRLHCSRCLESSTNPLTRSSLLTVVVARTEVAVFGLPDKAVRSLLQHPSEASRRLRDQ